MEKDLRIQNVFALQLHRRGPNLGLIIEPNQIWFLCWHKPQKAKVLAKEKPRPKDVPSTVSESSSSMPTSNAWSPTSTTGSIGTSPSPFKGKGKQKGKFTKGKSPRPPTSGASS